MNFSVKCIRISIKSPTYPRNWAESQRETDDEQNNAAQREDRDVCHVRAALLHAKVDAEHDQTQAHHDAGLEKQEPATSFLNEQGWGDCHYDLHDTDDDCADGWVQSAAGRLKDALGVEDDGVDAGELLEQHERQRDDEGHQVSANGEQIRQLCVTRDSVQVRLNVCQGCLRIALSSPEPL